MKRTTLITILIVATLASTVRFARSQILAHDLGTLGGSSSYAYGINSSGTIVGWSYTSDNAMHAFSYSGGVMTDIGTLGGSFSIAEGINSSGTIVGVSETSGGAEHAFSYSGGVMSDIGSLLGGSNSTAYAINDGGTIVGGFAPSTGGGTYHAFSYSGGVMTDLGTLLSDSNSTALAINSGSTIVGQSYTSNATHAFSYSGGLMADVGSLGGSFSFATGINSSGTIVGGSEISGGAEHAFSYRGGAINDLGTLGGSNSTAYAIDASGTIVGYSTTSGGGSHAFSYSGGMMTDLSQYVSSIGVAGSSVANAINDNGDIVGYGTISGFNVHAFLLQGVRTKPHAATALAVVTNGFFVGANLTDGGYGYTNIPTVKIIGGGGAGAQVVAVVSNEMVIAVSVQDAGFGYTNAPLIIIEPPFIPNPVLGIAPFSFLSFSNLTTGGVYQLQQLVIYYWSNQPLSFTATNSIYTQMFAGMVGGNNYRLALSPVPNQAFATPEVVNGIVVGATVTSGGSGYVTIPLVNIVADGGGSNATAIAQISDGMVTKISITSAGIAYTNAPTVRIAPPPAAAVYPTVLPVMRIDASSLAPYDNYQLQFQTSFGAAWGNWNGGLFSPTGATNSQSLFITNGTGFFRLEYVP